MLTYSIGLNDKPQYHAYRKQKCSFFARLKIGCQIQSIAKMETGCRINKFKLQAKICCYADIG